MGKLNGVWGLCLGVFLWVVSADAVFGAESKLIGVLPATPGGTDYQAYYDPEADLTWLADAQMSDGMTWSMAMEWAKSLNIGGVTGWRLPAAPQPDPYCDTQIAGVSRGFNCLTSDMGNLYYNVLGNKSYTDHCDSFGNCTQNEQTIENMGPFKNLVIDYYWTETTDPTDPTSAMYFDFRFGDQREVNKMFAMYVIAVHPGNVGHAKVPGKKH